MRLKNLGPPLDGKPVEEIFRNTNEEGHVTVTVRLLETVNKAYLKGEVLEVAPYELEKDK